VIIFAKDAKVQNPLLQHQARLGWQIKLCSGVLSELVPILTRKTQIEKAWVAYYE